VAACARDCVCGDTTTVRTERPPHPSPGGRCCFCRGPRGEWYRRPHCHRRGGQSNVHQPHSSRSASADSPLHHVAHEASESLQRHPRSPVIGLPRSVYDAQHCARVAPARHAVPPQHAGARKSARSVRTCGVTVSGRLSSLVGPLRNAEGAGPLISGGPASSSASFLALTEGT
jgi:hypothetical protein